MELTAAAAWLNTTFAAFDANITIAVHQLYEAAGGFFTPFFQFITPLGKAGVIVIAILLTLYHRTRRFGTAMLFSLCVGALFTNAFLKIYVARPRPYLDQAGIYYQYWVNLGKFVESDLSFPSGHTTAMFSTMTAVFLVGNKRISWCAYIIAFLVALSRIYLCVHYPTDVIAGVIVGTLGGLIGTFLARKLPEKWYTFNPLKRKVGKHECLDSRK